ncbi:MAG TPA: class I SAM-dependent methyltransferase [Microvirga sp.]|nr:class I SAM-dependent methyltransferase [Microvirga sp.]
MSNQAANERPCPACGSRTTVHFADERLDASKVNDFTYASRKRPEFMCLRLECCTNCDLVYAPAPPDSSFLASAYAEAAYDSGEEAKCAAESYARALAPYLGRLTSRKAAVDVGAGNGYLLSWFQQAGFSEAVGIEPSRAAINAAPANIRPLLREGMFSAHMLSDVTPSLICTFMTLEHLAEPDVFVKTAYDLLEPGGMIAIVVHNWQSWLNRVLGMRSPIIDIEHLQLFSPKSVRSLLKTAGFERIEVQSIRNSYPLRYWLRLTPIPDKLKDVMGDVLEGTGLAGTKVPFNVGNILAVGQKAAA